MLSLILPVLLSAPASSQEPPPITHGELEEGFPAVVGLGAMLGDDPQHVCTGSIISPRLVLTAAHCGDIVPIETIVAYGKAWVGTDEAAADHTLTFSNAWIHPDFEASGEGTADFEIDWDIAVLELAEDAPVEALLVRLEDISADERGRELLSIGFGATNGNGSGSGKKRSVSLELSRVQERFLQSNTDAGDGQICSGDSGGPQLSLEGERWVQWGVHSWGDAECEYKSGSFRPDVTAEWLLDIVEEVHGTRDLCEVNWFDNGVCDDDICPEDPDCFVADGDSGGAGGGGEDGGCGGCTAGAVGGAGLVPVMPLLLGLGWRRRQERCQVFPVTQ